MTCILPDLRQMLETEGLRYYLIPDQEGVLLNVRGTEGKYQFKILLELEGEFLQFKSVEYLYCPKGHPHLDATLQVLGEANYRLRLMKFGWDPVDGEIAAYADVWMKDAVITQGQFSQMANVYMSIMDDEYPKIKAAMESGVGPGGPISAEGGDDEEQVGWL